MFNRIQRLWGGIRANILKGEIMEETLKHIEKLYFEGYKLNSILLMIMKGMANNEKCKS